jgi:hypothetical protein
VLVEMLWWHPRSTADPAHAWLRERITEVGSVAPRSDRAPLAAATGGA